MLKILCLTIVLGLCGADIPIVINTWNFQQANKNAWATLKARGSAIDALVKGCETCQDEQCDTTVGYGGSPDENGESTLDALIFDGDTINMGAIGCIRQIKNVIGVARKVLENTEHSLLIGELAADFAQTFGFQKESLQTNYSLSQWHDWTKNNCQPNFWKNVEPDPKQSCGPYSPSTQILSNEIPQSSYQFNTGNHDTIGMIVISANGSIIAGTSTNGANHKIPGRVGDSPIPGAGAYADSEVGAAAATGDGDVMMRFLPSFLAVEQLRSGVSPAKAAREAIDRIAKKYPTFFGAIVVTNTKGEVGAACNGMDTFPYVISSEQYPDSVTKYVSCQSKAYRNKDEFKKYLVFVCFIFLKVLY